MADEQKPVRWYMQVKGTVPIIYERGAGQRFPIAVVEPLYANKSGEERQARGRLIAAAPEMYEILKKTLEFAADTLCYCPGVSMGHRTGAETGCVWESTQALLDKIDGSS